MADRVIDPLSNYTLPVTVTDPSDNSIVPDANVVATFYSPSKAKIASDVVCEYSGSAGIYNVPILPEYSVDDNGDVREGQYYADIVAVQGTVQRAVRAYYTVQFSAT